MSEPIAPVPIPSGPDREQQIYTLGLAGGSLSSPVPLFLLEQKAKETLSPTAYDYVAGGARGEDTIPAHREAFFRSRLVPPMLRHVSQRDLSLQLLGSRLPPPRILGPLGCQGLLYNRA